MAAVTDSLSYVEVNDVKLAYRESGNGEPIVLVHGHLADHRSWKELEAKLSDRFHVYSYSKRYAWPNTPIEDGKPQSWEQDSLDLGAFIETLNIGPVHALGNSSGSTVIVWLARTKPHLFRSLLLEEPPLVTLFMPTLPPSPLSALSFFLWHPISFFYGLHFGATVMGPAMNLAKKGDFEGAQSTFGSGCLGPKHWQRALSDPERKRQIDDNTKYVGHFLGYTTLPLYTAEDAKSIEIPTLVLTGTDGPYFQQCIDAEFIRLCGAQKKLEVKVQGAGHLTHEDSPDGVFKEILEFTNAADATS